MASELYKSIQKNTCGYFDTRTYSSKEEYQNALKNSTTLYIGNVNTKTREAQLYELFSRCGPVQRIIIGVNKTTLEPCGFAFVVYNAREDAMYAIKTLNGTRLNNQPIRTDLDPGFVEGRQYGRGKEGNQVRQDNQKPFAPPLFQIPTTISAAPPPVLAGPQSQSLLEFPQNAVQMPVYSQYQSYPPRGSGWGGYKRRYGDREDREDRDGGYPSKRQRYDSGDDRDGNGQQPPRRYSRQDYEHSRYHHHNQDDDRGSRDDRYRRDDREYRSDRYYRDERDDRYSRDDRYRRDDRYSRGEKDERDERDERRLRENRDSERRRDSNNNGDDNDVNMDETRVRKSNYTTRY